MHGEFSADSLLARHAGTGMSAASPEGPLIVRDQPVAKLAPDVVIEEAAFRKAFRKAV